MTITRVINGESVEIELTGNELFLAYYEQQHNFDIEDVKSLLDNDNWYWTDQNGESHPPKLTDEQIDDAACWARERLDMDDHIAEILWDTFFDAIREVQTQEDA